MSVTANDIAKACGVSRGTVDRALNGRPGINKDTKDKILKTAQAIGYKPDFLAKSLVTGKTMSIGVVVFDVMSPFFGQLVTSIEVQSRKQGYFTYLTLTHKNCEEEKNCIQHLIDRKVDGIILFSINKGKAFETFLKTITVPIVTITNKVSDEFDFVGIDERLAIHEALEHLYTLGHKNILYLSTPTNADSNTNVYAVEERLNGFKECSLSKGNNPNIEYIETEEDYKNIVINILAKKELPTAIMCSNDKYALKVMKKLKNNGIKIPDDISLVGFDDIDMLNYIEPGLTTVAFPIQEIGNKAVEVLLDKINSSAKCQPSSYILKHSLIVRQSVKDISC